MPKVDNLNTKAFQQLVLYFLRERVTHGNFQVKYLVVMNIYEWFIFDAEIFDRTFCLLFYQKNGFKTPCFQHGFILQYSEYRRAYGNSRLRS